MGIAGDWYKLFKTLHIIAVVVGFGGVALAGVYAAQARARKGREGLAISETVFHVTERWATWFIYAVPVLGIITVLLSDDQVQFSDTWISLSFAIYIVQLGIVHAVHLPNIRAMLGLSRELAAAGPPAAAGNPGGGPPPQVAEMEERGKRAAALGGVLNLLWVVQVFLMVFKPGA